MLPPTSPRLETDRLILRSPEPEDAEALFHAYASDPEVTRYLRWRPKAHPDEVREFIARASSAAERGSEAHWVIEARDGRSPLGVVTVWLDEHGAELGFALSRARWGRGIMTEGAGAVVQWLSGRPTIFRVWAYCDCDNSASARVLEKLGMQREGLLRRWSVHPNISPEPRDAFVFSRVR